MEVTSALRKRHAGREVAPAALDIPSVSAGSACNTVTPANVQGLGWILYHPLRVLRVYGLWVYFGASFYLSNLTMLEESH